MPRLAVVGNGIINNDQSMYIDECDVVVRFNECKNYGQNSGRKVDIVCICNSGTPAKRIIRHELIKKSQYHGLISEIWFPRDSEVHKNHTRVFVPSHPEDDLDDLSESLIESNSLSGKRIVRFTQDFNRHIFNTLLMLGHRVFICPSTGIFAIKYILDEERFFGYEKYLFGFGFKGWKGHPWRAEQDLIRHYSNSRKNFHFIPPSGGGNIFSI